MTRRSHSSTAAPLGAPVGRHNQCGGIVRTYEASQGGEPGCFRCDDCRAQDVSEDLPHYEPNLLERTAPIGEVAPW